MKNKVIHAGILAVFSFGCLIAWMLLNSLKYFDGSKGMALPGWTVACAKASPGVFVLIAFAATYCIWAWTRPREKVPSWVGFFAVTMSLLVIVDGSSWLASYLPLIPIFEPIGK
jgi:hypothetical protein